jgi:ClpP class serine protease
MFKKLDAREIEIIQGIVDFYYDKFVSDVARRRKLTTEEAEQVAQGKVWLGTDAFNKRLVDEIGGLYEAIKYAKKKSNLGTRFKIVYYAVPGGSTISQLVTSSVLKYFEKNLMELLGMDEDKDIEIIN